MAYQANPRTRVARRSLAASEALRVAWRTFALTRAAILLVAVLAASSVGGGGAGESNARVFDEPALTHSLGGFGDLILSPLARWDAIWYLSIAESGYEGARAAFFPLYPLAVRALGEVAGGSGGALLVAGYVVSLATFLAALHLLHRLVTLELGRPVAAPALLLLAVFPGSLYFGAPYSESLFLLVSVAAFLAARTGRFAWAGVCAGAAAATRSAGIVLVLPLFVIWLQDPRRRPADALWLLLGPLALGAYAAYLGLAHGDPFAFLDLQSAWDREFAGPLGGAWAGLTAALDGARQLLSGSRDTVYFDEAAGDPFRVATINLTLLAFLVLALMGLVGVFRRLPLAYGIYVGAALALPLSFPVAAQPLMSLPRFLAVLFPLFMWLALVCVERRATEWAVAASSLGLGWFVTQFATWHWVA